MERLDTISAVKQENINLCFGCLSAGRILYPVGSNYGLFFSLLDQRARNFIDPINTMLCWECTAILEKISKFQYKIQCAQSYVAMQQSLYHENISLSTLGICHSKHFNFNFKSEEKEESHTSHQENHLSKQESHTSNQDSYTINQEINTCIKTSKRANKKNIMKAEIKNLLLELQVADTELKKEKSSSALKEEKEDDEDYYEPMETENDYEELDSDKAITKDVKKKKRNSNFYGQMGIFVKNPNVDVENFSECFVLDDLTQEDIERLGTGPTKNRKRLRRYKCKRCNLGFNYILDQQRHITFCHLLKEAQGPFKCLSCAVDCADRAALRSHWGAHNRATRCKICGVFVHSAPCALRQHVVIHEFLVTCKKCPGVSYNSRRELTEHYKAAHAPATCDYCRRSFRDKHVLLRHIRVNHLSTECKKCNKVFKSPHNLHRHNRRMHDKPPPAPSELSYCVECNKQFENVEKYRRHVYTSVAHNPTRKRCEIVPCPECGKIFKRKTYMKNHYALEHRKQTKHYCALCDKYLVSQWSMKTHMAGVHLKLRLPKTKVCDVCGRAFSTIQILAKHRRTHTGERPFRCAHCPAAFTQKHPLKTHMRTQHKIEL